jgi:hypothetical protein
VQSQICGILLAVNTLINSLELSFTLYFLHGGTIYSTSKCTVWILVNYTLFTWSIYAMFWTSVERYLFIYHERLIKRHLIALHYGPIAAISLYCPLFYLGAVVVYNCQPAYDKRLYICGGPCYSLTPTLTLWDWIGNSLCMEALVFIVDVTVIGRHLIQRRRMKSIILTVDARREWVGQNLEILQKDSGTVVIL